MSGLCFRGECSELGRATRRRGTREFVAQLEPDTAWVSETGFPGRDTSSSGVPADTLRLPGLDHDQDVSLKSRFDSARICWAVSLSMTIIGPPQSGQVQVPRVGCGAVGGEGECGRGLVSRVWRHRVNNPARRRLARKPKERMRTKPRGSVCSRNRRRNSSAVTVMSRCVCCRGHSPSSETRPCRP